MEILSNKCDYYLNFLQETEQIKPTDWIALKRYVVWLHGMVQKLHAIFPLVRAFQLLIFSIFRNSFYFYRISITPSFEHILLFIIQSSSNSNQVIFFSEKRYILVDFVIHSHFVFSLIWNWTALTWEWTRAFAYCSIHIFIVPNEFHAFFSSSYNMNLSAIRARHIEKKKAVVKCMNKIKVSE